MECFKCIFRANFAKEYNFSKHLGETHQSNLSRYIALCQTWVSLGKFKFQELWVCMAIWCLELEFVEFEFQKSAT